MSITTQETVDEEAEIEESEVVETEVVADDELEPVDLELLPPRSGQAVALVAALVGVALSAPFTILALPFGVAGFVIMVISLTSVPSKGWASLGTALMFVGVLISGGFGVLPPEVLLLSVGAILVAWDAAQHAVTIGNQIGRASESHRNVLVHSAGTLLVVTLASGALFVVYSVAGDGHPAPGVGLIIVGIVLAAWLLRK